jgi:hypothetical protein
MFFTFPSLSGFLLACPLLLPARHNPISFLPVLSSLLHLPVVSPISCLPVPYFTFPSLSDFLPSRSSFTLLARPLPSPAVPFLPFFLSFVFFSVSFFFRCWCRANRSCTRIVARHKVLDLPCKRNCNPVLGASLGIGLRFVWRESFSFLVVQEEKLRIGGWLLLQRGFVGRHRASEASFFLRA